ncbi:hypothetical protein CJU89_0262 [Yarrowia sp. B02]|nr:hypothetical protein CJU89_0262 [Yarrowia sp. B02]
MAISPSPIAALAFEALWAKLNKTAPRPLSYFADKLSTDIKPFENHKFPLFVTWNTVEAGEHELRGCIGTFAPLELEKGLARFAIESGFHDTRFAPISKAELPQLQCEVTLLSNFTQADDMWDWTVGEHGIRIAFDYRGSDYGATFLPHVASEYNWTQRQTLEQLVRKAGARAKLEDLDIELTRYDGKVYSIDWEQYKNL